MTTLRGRLRHDVPMARYTTWRVGGPAETVYEPADAADLACFMTSDQRREPMLWLGLGSNLLVRDGGVRGSVIRLHRGLSDIEDLGAGRVRVGAGVPCAKLARWCAKHGYAGGAFFAGIPGTVGGALAMNAGAWGGETWAQVTAVQTVDPQGELRERGLEDFQTGYRTTQGPADEWFTAAWLAFVPGGDPDTLQAEMRGLLGERAETQPTGLPSGGSVFRNPPGDHAARLIEAAGLKGTQEGGAWVSDKHANFIVHRGEARAADIERLIRRVQRVVEETAGVALVPEVRIVGEASDDI
ncbi:UDP-N-acetylenolpyruvoylglucosamine reductase [Spiribacter salinus M19-40]|uniref:UDP-N-acetylenolpyruvoylglucosamine reductase n=1 Tax=Spiribacter salinus M19-40 TaxID=1260251 RepID=R4VPM9_9GAMM|nr:UDP-N-acetylmuramate dehydrogenase [Spiribacter salinus]AGM41458.1 UDP-N-acetylenolpyruvoylglucosamine reductase [Spiribacter salinus M19-40]